VSPKGVQRSRQPDPELRLDPALVAALASAGQRLTRHRAAVIVSLQQAGRPLDVDEVQVAADVPTSSAYRILTELCAAGVVARIHGADRSDRFEMAEAFSERHHHHHLICTVCGSVADVDAMAATERAIAVELAEVAARHGFQPTSHVFDIIGRCAACSA
jgi:Fur family ferric uptake transcriptional regulator